MKSTGHLPLIWVLVPLIFGYVLGQSFTNAPGIALSAAGLVLLIPGLGLTRPEKDFSAPLWGCLFITGLSLLSWSWWIVREPSPPPAPQPPAREVVTTLQIERIYGGPRKNGQLAGLARIVVSENVPDLRDQRCFFALWTNDFTNDVLPGARLQARAKLTPVPLQNPAGSFHAFLHKSGVYYTYETGEFIDLLKDAPVVERWAHAANADIRRILTEGAVTDNERQLAGIAQAMLLGWKNALGREQKLRYIESGTMHLFAVSGLHVAVVAGALAILLRWLRIPPKAGAVIGLSMLLAYVWIVGHPPSAIRAYLMTLFYWGAVVFARKPSGPSALLASAILLLVINPNELLRPGFQLSYTVVGGILLYGIPLANWLKQSYEPYKFIPEASLSKLQKAHRHLAHSILLSLGISISATIFSAPLVVQHFGVFTPGAILLNIVMIPLASAVIVIAGSAAVLGLLPTGFFANALNHLSWGFIWLLDQIVQYALMIPGIFYKTNWDKPYLAPISTASLFIAYLCVLQWGRFRRIYFLLPPVILIAFLSIG